MNFENKKQLATLLFAVVLGLAAAYVASQVVQNSINEQTKRLAEEYEKKTAAERQALMQEVGSRMQQLDQRIAQLSKQQQELATAVPKGGQAPNAPAQQPVFSFNTPPGKRAFTVLIDSLSAVGGLINPGDFVDVLANLQIPDPEDAAAPPQKVTSFLFQKIQVLAVGTNFKPVGDPTQYINQQNSRSLNITFALSPEEVGLLTFAQSHGNLQLSLRSPGEEGTQTLQVASWNALSDFVLQHQGTELIVPKQKTKIEEVSDKKPDKKKETPEEVKPFIQIFKSGKESNL